MQFLTIQSPAKLNLHLRILRRRTDGYHDLVTIFQKISLGDTIRIQKTRNDFRLTTNCPGLETGENNLITKAYRLLQTKYPGLGGVSVRLHKRIPLGAGLGGGSSNAAHFLLGMKKLFNLKISKPELIRLGTRLGADVPFFLLEKPRAIAWGKGEKLLPLETRSRLWFLLLVTRQGLSTKKVYQNLRERVPPLALTKEKRIAIILCSFFETKRIREAVGLAENDLETSAFSLRPSIPKSIKALRTAGASFVLMSGSGSTVFAVSANRKEIVALAKNVKLRALSYRKLICHSLNN